MLLAPGLIPGVGGDYDGGPVRCPGGRTIAGACARFQRAAHRAGLHAVVGSRSAPADGTPEPLACQPRAGCLCAGAALSGWGWARAAILTRPAGGFAGASPDVSSLPSRDPERQFPCA